MRKLIFATLMTTSLATAEANAAVVQGSTQPQANPHQSLVDQQILEVIAAAYAQGFRRVVADERGAMLNDGHPASFSVHLQEGMEYGLAARCDADCSDLDL